MTLAAALKAARERAGLTQTQLAEASNVSQQIISRVERGDGGASAKNLRRLSHATGTDLLQYVDTDAPAPPLAPEQSTAPVTVLA